MMEMGAAPGWLLPPDFLVNLLEHRCIAFKLVSFFLAPSAGEVVEIVIGVLAFSFFNTKRFAKKPQSYRIDACPSFRALSFRASAVFSSMPRRVIVVMVGLPCVKYWSAVVRQCSGSVRQVWQGQAHAEKLEAAIQQAASTDTL
jgi:hypothetical protein